MSQEQQTTKATDRVVVPVAPERATGVTGAPIIIDLRSSGLAADPDHAASTDVDPAPMDTPAPLRADAESQADVPREIQLVTVEDLTESTRALRRENAQLTAMINTMRADAQEEIAARDQLLADANRVSQQALELANSQLAAAHMQIDFSSGTAALSQPASIPEAVGASQSDQADIAALKDDLHQLATSRLAALVERDVALAARDEAIEERDLAVAERDSSADQAKDERATRLTELADLQRERNDLQQQLADVKDERAGLQQRLVDTESGDMQRLLDEAATERDRLTERLAQAASERAALESELAALHTAAAERDGLEAQLNDAITDRDRLHAELEELAQTGTERDEHLRSLSADRDQLADEITTLRSSQEAEALRATTQLHAALAERDREQAVTLHDRDTRLHAVHQQLEQSQSELARAHEAIASLTEQDHAGKVDALTTELQTARAELGEISTRLIETQSDMDERVQRAFEAGSHLGERAAERLARLLPTDSH